MLTDIKHKWSDQWCLCPKCKFYCVEYFKETVERKGEDILFPVPDSAGDVLLSTSLLPSIKELFPEKNIYFATNSNNWPILKDNKYIYKIIAFHAHMCSHFFEGIGNYRECDYWSIIYDPVYLCQRSKNFYHNGLKASNLEFKNAYN